MNTVALGNSGAQVSEIALGTMYFGSTVSDADSMAMLDAYFERGGSFIDTANNYIHWVDPFMGGDSERLIGRWMKSRGNREQAFVATKIGFDIRGEGAGLTPRQVRENIDRCLINLQTDHIDLLYMHCDDRDTALEDSLGALNDAVGQGKARFLGASNFASWRAMKALDVASANGLAKICCLQNRLSFLAPHSGFSTAPQVLLSDECLDLCANEGLLPLAFSPLLQGAYCLPERPLPVGYDSELNRARRQRLFELAKEMGVSPNQLALAWMRARGIVPLVTGENATQLAENLDAARIALSTDELV